MHSFAQAIYPPAEKMQPEDILQFMFALIFAFTRFRLAIQNKKIANHCRCCPWGRQASRNLTDCTPHGPPLAPACNSLFCLLLLPFCNHKQLPESARRGAIFFASDSALPGVRPQVEARNEQCPLRYTKRGNLRKPTRAYASCMFVGFSLRGGSSYAKKTTRPTRTAQAHYSSLRSSGRYKKNSAQMSKQFGACKCRHVLCRNRQKTKHNSADGSRLCVKRLVSFVASHLSASRIASWHAHAPCVHTGRLTKRDRALPAPPPPTWASAVGSPRAPRAPPPRQIRLPSRNFLGPGSELKASPASHQSCQTCPSL